MTQSQSPLTAYREANKLTLEDIGKRLNVNKSTVLRWERCEKHIPIERAAELSKFTGIPLEKLRPDIFGGAA